MTSRMAPPATRPAGGGAATAATTTPSDEAIIDELATGGPCDAADGRRSGRGAGRQAPTPVDIADEAPTVPVVERAASSSSMRPTGRRRHRRRRRSPMRTRRQRMRTRRHPVAGPGATFGLPGGGRPAGDAVLPRPARRDEDAAQRGARDVRRAARAAAAPPQVAAGAAHQQLFERRGGGAPRRTRR